MKKYNTVLFDLDGTLLDTNALILDSFHHAFDKLYKEVPEKDTLTSFFGMTLIEAFRKLAREEKDIEILLSSFREYNLSNHDDYVKIFPGVEDTIIRLKKNDYKIGVVTSKLNKTAKRGLKLFDLEKHVDVFIGADDTHIHKPDPFPVLECLRRINSQGESSFMVGDSPHDITAGKLSGCRTVFVNYSMVNVDRTLLECDYRINEMTELTKILNSE